MPVRARSGPGAAIRAALGAGLLAAVAGAEGLVHPLPASPPPLHRRVAAADVVVLATVDRVELGRIHLREAVGLLGPVEGRIALKRAPSRPPPLETGDRALLLLRGARSPYVLAGPEGATIALENDADAERWSAALAELVAARAAPGRLLGLYLEWLDGPHADQREEAATALVGPDADLDPLPAEVAVARARRASDPRTDSTARRVSALLAARRPEGLSTLLATQLAAGAAADPEVFGLVLALAAKAHHPELAGALFEALAHPSAKIRRSALAVAPQAWTTDVAARVARMADEDPDLDVRAVAGRVAAAQRGAP